MIVCETPTLPTVVASEDGEMKNAPELAALGTFAVACATTSPTIEYSTEPAECQAFSSPSFEDIENEIAAAAQKRIQAALCDLGETRARLERERNAREAALKAAQERVSRTRSELDGLAGERAAMERRAQTFLADDGLKAVMEKIHLAFNVRQLVLEDALATAEADVLDMLTEIQAALISDALELQLAEQYLDQFESAAPDVAQTVRLAADAAENIAAALQAAKDGLVRDAAVLLAKAKAGNADSMQVAQVEQVLAEAHREQIARDLVARINADIERPGAVRRIRKLMEEAETAGVADRVAPAAERALASARSAANARFAQAKPVAEHLASEGFVPVVGDGRIEAWKETSRNGHDVIWTLESVMLLRDGAWKSENPRVPVTSQELPPRVQQSRWFHRSPAEKTAP